MVFPEQGSLFFQVRGGVVAIEENGCQPEKVSVSKHARLPQTLSSHFPEYAPMLLFLELFQQGKPHTGAAPSMIYIVLKLFEYQRV